MGFPEIQKSNTYVCYTVLLLTKKHVQDTRSIVIKKPIIIVRYLTSVLHQLIFFGLKGQKQRKAYCFIAEFDLALFIMSNDQNCFRKPLYRQLKHSPNVCYMQVKQQVQLLHLNVRTCVDYDGNLIKYIQKSKSPAAPIVWPC